MENQQRLFDLVDFEDIMGKKAMVYSRLLTDPALAKSMQQCAARHEKRKEGLLSLALGKSPKKKNEQGRCEVNEGEEKK